jgi:hypothetical protein
MQRLAEVQIKHTGVPFIETGNKPVSEVNRLRVLTAQVRAYFL